MERSFVLPSVFEENSYEFQKVAENFVDGIKIMDFAGKDYIIGNLALREGESPHKLINPGVSEIDYQLMAVTALLVASMGRFSRLVVTTGFPFTTYQSYKKEAEKFLLNRFEVNFDSRTFGGNRIEKAVFQVDKIDIMTEVDGCVKAIRDGVTQEKDNFFVACMGYGTFEIAQSLPKGIVQRTSHSTKGLQYAVNLVENELKKGYYLNLITEQQLERAFQRGLIVLDRKRVNLKEMRYNALESYYKEVISPSIKRKITDEDYTNTDKMYLVGGGAMYQELVEMFKNEFGAFLDIIVFPEPYLAAAKGYCLQSMGAAKTGGDYGSRENTAYVGIDIGNANTVIYVNTAEGREPMMEHTDNPEA